MNQPTLIFLIVLYSTTLTFAQESVLKNSFSLRVSELINLELGVDYQRLIKEDKLSLYYSAGIKFHRNLPKTIGSNQKVRNFYTAKVRGSSLSAMQGQTILTPILQSAVIEYYHNTTSYAIYNGIQPTVSVPIGIGFRVTLNPKSKINFFYGVKSFIYTHIGKVLDTETRLLSDVTPPGEITQGYRVGNFEERIKSKFGAKPTFSMAVDFGFRFAVSKNYFFEINPEVGFYIGTIEPVIKYRGIKQFSAARLVVSVGKYL